VDAEVSYKSVLFESTLNVGYEKLVFAHKFRKA